MRKSALPAAALLLGILALSLWNGFVLSRWIEAREAELDRAETLIESGDLPGAAETLAWELDTVRSAHTYLHIVCRHDGADGAETLYLRCRILAEAGDAAGCLAELAQLRQTLTGLAEMERLSIGNIL